MSSASRVAIIAALAIACWLLLGLLLWLVWAWPIALVFLAGMVVLALARGGLGATAK